MKTDREKAGLRAEPVNGGTEVRFSGSWSRDAERPGLDSVWPALQESSGPVRADGSGLTGWDSSLLAALVQLQERLKTAGRTVDLSAMPAGVDDLLELTRAAPEQTAGLHGGEPPTWLARLGLASKALATDLWDNVVFLGESLQAAFTAAAGRGRGRRRDFALLLQECGPEALPLITLLSLLVGMILAFLGSVQLKLFGAQLYIADLVAIGMVREMGALMTGIIMAGRTGADFASHLGAMQANDEIDALRTTGLPPMEFLVLPRLAALVLTMPLLTLYADAMGILGGAIVGVGMLDLTAPQYLTETIASVIPRDIVAGLLKSLVYGAVIALAGCRQGLRCGRSASAVGEATTRAVVQAIVGLILWDSLITIVYTITGF